MRFRAGGSGGTPFVCCEANIYKRAGSLVSPLPLLSIELEEKLLFQLILTQYVSSPTNSPAPPTMHLSTTAALLSLLSLTTAHFSVEYPEWRGDSFAEYASQYTFPCANISETLDITNRTAWSPNGGSLRLHVSHPWALTYVNLGIGTNITSFNVSLVEGFNQTGNGTFCLKETGRAALQEAMRVQGVTDPEGVPASLQIIQIAHSGASLYNVCSLLPFLISP